MFKKTLTLEADTLEQNGHRLLKQKKWGEAYAQLHEAIEADPTRTHLYDTLIHTLNNMKEDWTEEHFAHSVHWQMKKQEIENPALKLVHARSEPEFAKVMECIKQMLSAKSAANETECIEKIIAFGTDALYPLVDMLLAFKQAGKKQPTDSL